MRNETCVLRNGDQVGFGGCSKNENGAYIDYSEYKGMETYL